MTGERYVAVYRRGLAVRDDPILNKGTCFTSDEREALGLRGLLPPAVASPSEQVARAYENFLRAPDSVARYLFLAGLQDRNETLFYRLILEHVEEMVPIVYTPTVGLVCQQYSHLYRRPRGIYLSARDRGRVAEALRHAERPDTQIIVVTDNEAILGLGDQGVGGMGIAVGKLALYTAGAGIHPARTLPIDLDVGTDNPELLGDPLYLGVREPRLRGDAYFSLLDELVEAIGRLFPGALVQWEDFANERAFEVLHRYRRQLPSFDDDIQGTGAVIEAGVRTALERVGRDLKDERVVFYGAGASGAGCALQLRRAMREAGLRSRDISQRILCLDRRGLILGDRPGLAGHKRDVAAAPDIVAGWPEPSGSFGLLDVVRHFRPTILIGASGQPGAFTEQIVKAMHRQCARPIILALSNPTANIEAQPSDILRWTHGAAVVGTGSPFEPVILDGAAHEIGQGNNVLAFPGIGLGATAVGARWIPDEVFSAAARAIHEITGPSDIPGAAIFPRLTRLREVSREVAITVGRTLVAADAAPALSPHEIERRVAANTWEPVYRHYRRGV